MLQQGATGSRDEGNYGEEKEVEEKEREAEVIGVVDGA
jgi:hypothetical protein